MIHELKCWPEPFAATCRGEKFHEFRRDDRGFAVGDELILREFNPGGTIEGMTNSRYSGDVIPVRVTYISRGQFGIPDGFCVMSIEEIFDPVESPAPPIPQPPSPPPTRALS